MVAGGFEAVAVSMAAEAAATTAAIVAVGGILGGILARGVCGESTEDLSCSTEATFGSSDWEPPKDPGTDWSG